MRRISRVVTAAWVSVGLVGGGLWADSRPAGRVEKESPVNVRLASSAPVPNGEELVVGGRAPVYLIPQAAVSGNELTSAEAINARTESDIDLSLTPAAAKRLSGLIDAHHPDRAVVYMGRKPVAVGNLSFAATSGVLTVVGVSAEQADQVIRTIRGTPVAPVGPTYTVVAPAGGVAPGGAVTVDVFVHGVANLRAYQVRLEVSGGSTGSVTVENIGFSAERADYVFGDLQKVDAVDLTGERMMGALMTGGVAVPQRAHAGWFTLRASPDASGSFNVSVKTSDRDTMLLDPNGEELSFHVGPAATITVGGPTPLTPVEK